MKRSVRSLHPVIAGLVLVGAPTSADTLNLLVTRISGTVDVRGSDGFVHHLSSIEHAMSGDTLSTSSDDAGADIFIDTEDHVRLGPRSSAKIEQRSKDLVVHLLSGSACVDIAHSAVVIASARSTVTAMTVPTSYGIISNADGIRVVVYRGELAASGETTPLIAGPGAAFAIASDGTATKLAFDQLQPSLSAFHCPAPWVVSFAEQAVILGAPSLQLGAKPDADAMKHSSLTVSPAALTLLGFGGGSVPVTISGGNGSYILTRGENECAIPDQVQATLTSSEITFSAMGNGLACNVYVTDTTFSSIAKISITTR